MALRAGITLNNEFKNCLARFSHDQVATGPRYLPRDLHINSKSSVSPRMAFRTIFFFLIATRCIGALLCGTRIGSTRGS